MAGPLQSIEAPGTPFSGDDLFQQRREVATLLDRKNLSFPGAQPVSFSRRHLEELKREDYYVCEKSDGMRYLLYLTEDPNGQEAQFLIDRRNDFWLVPPGGLHFPIPKSVEEFHRKTLIDGELVFDKLPNGQMQPKYLVFDCLILDGNSLMNRTLDKRLAYFKERIMAPYDALFKEFPQEKQFQHFIMEMKAMQLGYAIDFMFTTVLPELAHGNDGLIFTCRTSDYKHGTDQHILKWKPELENSIDFRLRLDFNLVEPDEQDRAEGITKPYMDYENEPICNLHMYAGDGREDPWYGTLYLEPGEWEKLKALQEPLDDRIVECFMDTQKRWRYMRFRDDKENANHTSTVESVIESITDRVTKQDLINASQAIRTEWKARERKEAEKRRVATEGVPNGSQSLGVKRKADEQAPGRPSPGPPAERKL